MKNWTKVGLGLLAGGLVGAGIAFLGKKKNSEDDEYYVEVEETETDDSEADA